MSYFLISFLFRKMSILSCIFLTHGEFSLFVVFCRNFVTKTLDKNKEDMVYIKENRFVVFCINFMTKNDKNTMFEEEHLWKHHTIHSRTQ